MYTLDKSKKYMYTFFLNKTVTLEYFSSLLTIVHTHTHD